MSSPLISFTNLSWCTPDGRSLFSNLNLSFESGRTGLVGRNGVGKTTLLKLASGELQPLMGRVDVRGRVACLRQSIRTNSTETVAECLGVAQAWALLRRAEDGAATIEELADVDWSLESRILSALARVRLDAEPNTRLGEMSGGECTRVRLAAALYAEPDFLLLDEPTNHLDHEGREAVISFLAKWKGGAVIVSHDRGLLETMDAIVELTSLGATTYGGNWSHYREQKSAELAEARRDLVLAERRVAEVARKTQAIVEKKARKDAVGRRQKEKGGIPRIALGLMKNRSEDTSGMNTRLAERQQAEAADSAAAARRRMEILEPFSVVLPSTALAAGKTVLEMDDVSVGYVPGQPVLRHLSLRIAGPERIAISGPNGSGKTTSLQLISGTLKPWTGQVRIATEFAMLDQQMRILDGSQSIRDNFLRLNPEDNEQACRASLARFRFRADAAHQIAFTLSGGQVLRAALACVLGGTRLPRFLVLDEPTNHLDIESLEAVESGLRAYDGALLVVSHDESFLQNIGITRCVSLSPQRRV